MIHIPSPDGIRRLKMLAAIIGAYLLSVFVVDIFFVGASPSLNQNAFQTLGQKINSFKTLLINQTADNVINQPSNDNAVLNAGPTQGSKSVTPIMNASSQAPLQTSSAISSAAQLPTQMPSIRVPTAIPTTVLPTPTFTPSPSPATSKVTYAQFGQCLNDKSMVMYMSATCGLCAQQKKTLKEAFNYIRSVDCNVSQQNGLECSQVGVRGLPTWGKNGKAVLSGPQTIAALAQESGCQAPTQ